MEEDGLAIEANDYSTASGDLDLGFIADDDVVVRGGRMVADECRVIRKNVVGCTTVRASVGLSLGQVTRAYMWRPPNFSL